MISPLRRRHRGLVAVVTIAVVPLFVVALAARPDRPRVDGFAEGIEWPEQATAEAIELELRTDPPIRVVASPRERTVVLEAPEAVEGPDLLLYWLPTGDTAFPDGAVLIGPVRGHGREVLALPPAAENPGSLVLFSLGHGEELARAEWPGAAER